MGIYDQKMGTTDMSYHCGTCFHSKTKCGGHFGKIQLPYAVVSPLFKKEVLKWLKIICLECGSILLPDSKLLLIPISERFAKLSTLAQKLGCHLCGAKHQKIIKSTEDNFTTLIDDGKVKIKLYPGKIKQIFNPTEVDIFCHVWDFNTPPNEIISGANHKGLGPFGTNQIGDWVTISGDIISEDEKNRFLNILNKSNNAFTLYMYAKSIIKYRVSRVRVESIIFIFRLL